MEMDLDLVLEKIEKYGPVKDLDILEAGSDSEGNIVLVVQFHLAGRKDGEPVRMLELELDKLLGWSEPRL